MNAWKCFLKSVLSLPIIATVVIAAPQEGQNALDRDGLIVDLNLCLSGSGLDMVQHFKETLAQLKEQNRENTTNSDFILRAQILFYGSIPSLTNQMLPLLVEMYQARNNNGIPFDKTILYRAAWGVTGDVRNEFWWHLCERGLLRLSDLDRGIVDNVVLYLASRQRKEQTMTFLNYIEALGTAQTNSPAEKSANELPVIRTVIRQKAKFFESQHDYSNGLSFLQKLQLHTFPEPDRELLGRYRCIFSFILWKNTHDSKYLDLLQAYFSEYAANYNPDCFPSELVKAAATNPK